MEEGSLTKDIQCPQCGSVDIKFDKDYGFYTCNACDHAWAYSKDDPDFDELDEDIDLN
ncbi:MAG: hypothetical protein JGK24_17015 [Microcoleus sp. PH2017_29_MFU_D_A]|uniref:hypothetical protein n=1 Tax=unclassified Microcoleus TaxID=2642155 RepID=UPI001DDD7FB1|nr:MULTISPECIES: hypothetical protein [unclassified Microcoleus]MCC3410546.1 hypothetical protein [Microcoleus sp. PH2017_02_FOX_O_A]MCC3437501.1 hypothetical protein [Microcoleus sp. PH2017_05_CCC_O_A]MCC3455783.1 hypothetical protein [Microcoleus sp. PH2017_08_TRC_O_A]MCC3473286.1 hypothetical protein [Microcoleus sp. PH2017_13_LAR_U_A]MCC3486547.1 hypothetical protein [Microcoleus sp. PH2017_14_LAR_D_A]